MQFTWRTDYLCDIFINQCGTPHENNPPFARRNVVVGQQRKHNHKWCHLCCKHTTLITLSSQTCFDIATGALVNWKGFRLCIPPQVSHMWCQAWQMTYFVMQHLSRSLFTWNPGGTPSILEICTCTHQHMRMFLTRTHTNAHAHARVQLDIFVCLCSNQFFFEPCASISLLRYVSAADLLWKSRGTRPTMREIDFLSWNWKACCNCVRWYVCFSMLPRRGEACEVYDAYEETVL